MNKTLIGIHILPQEIDQLERQLIQLEKSKSYLEDEHVEIYCVLNLSPELFEWTDNSIKKMFISKFNEIYKYSNWFKKSTFIIVDDNSMLGCVDFRRNVVEKYDQSITDFIFLDSDIYFHETLLYYLINSAKNITNEYYIISPQTVKLWDSTWDVLVHDNFINEQYGFEKTFNHESACVQQVSDIGLKEIFEFKFAGGWFNLYSANLWRLAGVPKEFGPYGVEDTYIMYAAEKMFNKSYDVKQYVLCGQYICESYKYKNPYNNVIQFKNKKNVYLSRAQSALMPAVNKFDSNLKFNEK